MKKEKIKIVCNECGNNIKNKNVKYMYCGGIGNKPICDKCYTRLVREINPKVKENDN